MVGQQVDFNWTVSQDFRPLFFDSKDSTWAPYEQAKMVGNIFNFHNDRVLSSSVPVVIFKCLTLLSYCMRVWALFTSGHNSVGTGDREYRLWPVLCRSIPPPLRGGLGGGGVCFCHSFLFLKSITCKRCHRLCGHVVHVVNDYADTVPP